LPTTIFAACKNSNLMAAPALRPGFGLLPEIFVLIGIGNGQGASALFDQFSAYRGSS